MPVIEVAAGIFDFVIAAAKPSARRKKTSSSSSSVSPSPKEYPRATLVASSQIEFGNACERLVNSAFQTSQTSTNTMKACADVSQHLQKELRKEYPNEKFYVIIGENGNFGFCVTDAKYFAEIEQERYRVLIFNAKRGAQMNFDTHDANSQMPLVWQ